VGHCYGGSVFLNVLGCSELNVACPGTDDGRTRSPVGHSGADDGERYFPRRGPL
jgi:hypothetical protein